MTSRPIRASRKCRRKFSGMNVTSSPVPRSRSSRASPSSKTGASEVTVISRGSRTAQAWTPEGSARIEPRWDMSAKRKPPLPYASIGYRPGTKPSCIRPADMILLRRLRHPARLPRHGRRGGGAAHAEIDQHRRRDEDRRIRADHDTPEHHLGEALDGPPAEDHEGNEGERRRGGGHH